MLITFFRAILLYILVLVVMRLMGKREIGQLQPFELAISIMIADSISSDSIFSFICSSFERSRYWYSYF